MGVKLYTLNLSDLSKNDSLRIGKSYSLPRIKYPFHKLLSLLEKCETGSRPKGGINDEDEGEAISLGGEQIGKDGAVNLSKIPYVSYQFYENAQNGKVNDLDILICKDGALTGKTCIVESSQLPTDMVMVNEHVYVIRSNKQVNQRFLFYLTRTDTFQKQIQNFAYSKKAQPGLNLEHLKKIKIPNVPIDVQKIITDKLNPIGNFLNELKLQIKEPIEIINEIFAKEFKYNPAIWKKFGKGMTAGSQKSNPRTSTHFPVQSSQVSLSNILRFSSRYHNPVTIQLNEILETSELWRVEDVVADIKKGVQPTYKTDGEVKVVKIANMKNGYIDFTEAEYISEEFFDSVKDKAGIEQGDILLCCTGKVSLGKIDYYDLDEPAILSVDSYTIRINEEKVHPLFFIYFFRSILGAYQIERDYTGTTNQIHLYESQIRDFRIPKIDIEYQQKIVDQIKKSLDAQKEIKKQIEEKQNEISKIIEDAIKESPQ